jgi:hypothetical protein
MEVSTNGKLSMAVPLAGWFGHFPPWGNQGTQSKGSACCSESFKLIKKTGNYSFWARGYFVSTVGHDEEAVRRYIQAQEAEDRRLEQRELFKQNQ